MKTLACAHPDDDHEVLLLLPDARQYISHNLIEAPVSLLNIKYVSFQEMTHEIDKRRQS